MLTPDEYERIHLDMSNTKNTPTLTKTQLHAALCEASHEIREYNGEVTLDELFDYLGDYYREFNFDRALARKLASKLCE